MFAKDLAKLIRTLATLEPDEAPIVSCYVDLTGRPQIDEQRARVLGHAVGAAWQEPFEEALDRIRAYIARCLRPDAKGLAIFARGSPNPMFLPIQSLQPLPDRLVVNSTPDMIDLLKFEDHSESYLAVRVGGNAANVFEIRLGAITRPIWNRYEAFRSRFVRQRARVTYGRGGPEDDVIEELTALLNALVESQAPEAVILEGSGKTGRRVAGALREGLAPSPRLRSPSVREVQAGLRTAAAEPAWPDRIISMVLPFAPGGPADLIGRMFAQKLGTALGRPIVFENRPGAGGTIGSAYVARATPNGYTLLFGASSTHAIVPAL
ncbi:MAG TPA: tripartite tricarboxylate transporter substrate-binding protein, partial [Bryobacteraceae bacterium]|nr:tripartite tricarboxylate transporter substrate-binding protein [Bryobacteraceae bacterium]